MKRIPIGITLMLFSCFQLLSSSLNAQGNFPAMTAEDVQGKQLNIPQDLKGKKSILFLAMTPQAEKVLESWYEPVYIMFIDESGFNALAYDCHVKLMLLFTGSGQAVAEDVIHNIKANVDESYSDHLLFYKGPLGELQHELGIKKKNDAYVVVLDEEGKVMLLEHGQYSERKLEQIAELVEL